jgi:N-acyl-D-aspartate/D-glutamate deacylase
VPEFDLVIRGGTAATAADVFRTDVGVRDGRIVALPPICARETGRSMRAASSFCRAGSTRIATSISRPATSR